MSQPQVFDDAMSLMTERTWVEVAEIAKRRSENEKLKKKCADLEELGQMEHELLNLDVDERHRQ